MKLNFYCNRNIDSVILQLRGFAGSNYEEIHQVGAAHLCEHMSLNSEDKEFTTTKTYLLEHGAQIFAVTSRDDALFMIRCLKQHYTKALSFLLQIFRNELTSEKAFETAKKQTFNEIARVGNNPEKYSLRLTYKLLFEGTRAAKLNLGESEDVEKLQLTTVQNFKKALYKSKHFSLCGTGNIEESKIVETVDKQGIKQDFSVLSRQLEYNSDFKVLAVKNVFYKQTHLRISLESATSAMPRNNDTVQVVHEMIAKHIELKLKNTFKETSGELYSLACTNISSQNYSFLTLYALIDNNKLLHLVREIKKTFQTSDIDTKTSETIKNQCICELIYSMEKPSHFVDYHSQINLAHKHNRSVYDELELFKKLTLTELLDEFIKLKWQQAKIVVLSDCFDKQAIENAWQEL